jgi:hypothetical protein
MSAVVGQFSLPRDPHSDDPTTTGHAQIAYLAGSLCPAGNRYAKVAFE